MTANFELAFFDTNVLLYADDLASPAKRQIAIALYAEHRRHGAVALSLQVMQEYFSVATRKLGLSPEAAQHKVALFADTTVVCFQASDVVAAIELHRLRRVSFWDALIIHAARIAGCAILYSEDLQAGATIRRRPHRQSLCRHPHFSLP